MLASEYKDFIKNSKYDENNLENLYNKINEINKLIYNCFFKFIKNI